jgi:transcriptional pleiotropic regulator of transition state genes
MMTVSESFEVVKLTSKGQMTLPVMARKKLGLKKGDHLAVFIQNNELVLRKLFPLKQATPQDAIFSLLGQWDGPADLAENHDQYLADAVDREAKP